MTGRHTTSGPDRVCTARRAIAAGALVLLLGSASDAAPCVVPDDGTGTAEMPPIGCEYTPETPGDTYVIIDGLPPGTTLELTPVHKDFLCGSTLSCSAALPPGACETAGGSLGGDLSCSDSIVELQVAGTGLLAGFNRVLQVPLFWETHGTPRTLGAPVQTFSTEMFRMEGQLFGDPDFDILSLRAGPVFGLPSPGETTLTRLGSPGSDFDVDSFFDLTYQIEFQGAPGSVLDGFAGTTTSTIRIRTGESLASSIPSVPLAAAAALAALIATAGAVGLARIA